MLTVDIKTVIVPFCYEVPINKIHTHTLIPQQCLSEYETALDLLKPLFHHSHPAYSPLKP